MLESQAIGIFFVNILISNASNLSNVSNVFNGIYHMGPFWGTG